MKLKNDVPVQNQGLQHSNLSNFLPFNTAFPEKKTVKLSLFSHHYKRGGWVTFWVFYSAQLCTDFGQLYSSSEIVYNVNRRSRLILINDY